MISTLFRRKPRTIAPAQPQLTRGTVAWAIGDVHGRLDLLEPLIEAIIADADATPAERKVGILLGDYVDRGPDSRGVLRHLAALSGGGVGAIEWRFLKGNHEEAMLDFLSDPAAGARWCEYGGDATLASYGLRTPEMKHRPEGWARLSADLNHKLDRRERAFLEDLELTLSIGDYFFVHAGARPGVPLERQADRDLMWIRNSFLESEEEFEKVVVHGHTPTAEVHIDRRRIGVDTKAYDSGVLTAIRLERSEKALIRALKSDDGPVRIERLGLSSGSAA